MYTENGRNKGRYLNEIRSKARNDTSYQFILDQTLAEYCLYNGLWGKNCLESKEALLGELHLRQETDSGLENQGYDNERLQNFHERFINDLLKEYE